MEIRPHLVRYWLHSSEKTDSPETFAEKVNEFCTVYHETEAVCAAGGHTISVDEMTGIQALEHKYPDKPVIPGKAGRMESPYTYRGGFRGCHGCFGRDRFGGIVGVCVRWSEYT